MDNTKMLTEEECVKQYLACKISKGGIPEYREYLKFAGIAAKQLSRLFGTSAYTKLQLAAGDTPNKLTMERTPLATIMRQYGELVMELGTVPAYAEWDHRGLKPTQSGLKAQPHNMRWSELPTHFAEWIATNKIVGFEKALEVIAGTASKRGNKPEVGDSGFAKLINDVRAWVPARRRNSEAEYKIELRKHLEAKGYKLNEEFGESKYDLLVQHKYAIELKKDPDLSEYDRLFGQLARHLQHQCKAIVLVIEATRKDKFDNFSELVDRYLNLDVNSVEIIGR